MAEAASSGGSHNSAGLLLRVQRSGGRVDDFYLAHGLTIGRTVANTIVLDDDDVARQHARVEFAADGSARLRALDAGGAVLCAGRPLADVPLAAGVRFQIGRTTFQCVSGLREAAATAPDRRVGCPRCGATAALSGTERIRHCPACGEPLLAVPAAVAGAADVLVPVKYGDWRAEEFVAWGGMGLVLRGVHRRGHRAVAIKILPDAGEGRFASAERFERESEILGRVRDPHVVALLEHGRSGTVPYLVMEWVAGRTLQNVIAECYGPQAAAADRPAVPFATAAAWWEHACRGLAAIHALGVVHRDVKPSNILIDATGQARIADLGLARPLDEFALGMTTSGQAPGTFAYMAPEQIGAPDSVDARADLYSLGVTFYELLTGARPVGVWQPASAVNSSVPAEFDKVLARLLAPQPAQRFATAEEALEALWGRRPPGADCGELPPPPSESDLRSVGYLVLAGALLGFLLGGAWNLKWAVGGGAAGLLLAGVLAVKFQRRLRPALPRIAALEAQLSGFCAHSPRWPPMRSALLYGCCGWLTGALLNAITKVDSGAVLPVVLALAGLMAGLPHRQSVAVDQPPEDEPSLGPEVSAATVPESAARSSSLNRHALERDRTIHERSVYYRLCCLFGTSGFLMMCGRSFAPRDGSLGDQLVEAVFVTGQLLFVLGFNLYALYKGHHPL